MYGNFLTGSWPISSQYFMETITWHGRSIGSYPNLRDVPPNPLPERAARGQWMTAVHSADEGLEPRSPMHLRTKTKNGSYMIWPGTGLTHAPELWTRFLGQPNSLEGFWKKHSSYFAIERKGRYVLRKISQEQLIVSGIWGWQLRLLRILPIWPAPLDFCWLGAPAYFFESNLASSWAPPVVTLKLDLNLHRCSDQNRYAFPLIALFEKLFFVDSSTSFCQHIVVSQKDNRDISRGGTSKESSKEGVHAMVTRSK